MCSTISCPLAFFGHNRDKKKGKKQIMDCFVPPTPVAYGSFKKIQRRFGVDNVALVGDRGMITHRAYQGISNLAVLVDIGTEDNRHPQAAEKA